jgi:L-aspartate oxidase
MTPVIVVGHGVAGMQAALGLAESGRPVLLLHKGDWAASNTYLAQGGVAAALGPDDSAADHARDTLTVARGLADPEAVAVLTDEAEAATRALRRAGVFVEARAGRPHPGQEAGHSRPRVLRAPGGATGRAVARALRQAVAAHPAITVRSARVTRVGVARGRVAGVFVSGDGPRPEWIPAAHVVLATGGFAGLWRTTTNPPATAGDGLALAYDAGAVLADLEFVQFHPTALAVGETRPALLLSEALRGRGARLVDAEGRPAVADLPAGELTPRDELARAVGRHWITQGPVFLTLAHLHPRIVEEEFADLARAVAAYGRHLATDPLPVRPAAHFTMGGIVTDLEGRTTVPGLWAVGECAVVGVHGANRLASNSLLEGLVFGRRVAQAIAREAETPPAAPAPAGPLLDPAWPEDLAAALDEHLGVVRTAAGLQDLLRRLGAAEPPDRPGPITVVRLAAEAALARTESRGGHWRADYPDTDPRWRGHLCHQRDTPLWFCPSPEKGGLFDAVVRTRSRS